MRLKLKKFPRVLKYVGHTLVASSFDSAHLIHQKYNRHQFIKMITYNNSHDDILGFHVLRIIVYPKKYRGMVMGMDGESVWTICGREFREGPEKACWMQTFKWKNPPNIIKEATYDLHDRKWIG